MIPDEDTVFHDAYQVESRPLVNKIASAIGEKMATFFYSHTCSMRTHIVMKHLKAYLDSNEALEEATESLGRAYAGLSGKEREALQDNLTASICSVVVRAWDNIFNIWMHYMCHSLEKPVGSVHWYVIRKELQEVVGNMYHGHSILWCREDDGSEEGLAMLLSKIRASMSNIVTHGECQQFLNEGVVSSVEELWSILADLKRMPTHTHHRRCMIPVVGKPEGCRETTGNRDRDADLMRYRCKVPDNHLLRPNPANHCFVWLSMQHTEAAIEILEDLGLAVRVEGREGLADFKDFKHLHYIDKSLEAKHYIPPTGAAEGVLSPVLARLCVINPTSNNIQHLDSYGVSKYLAKYVE